MGIEAVSNVVESSKQQFLCVGHTHKKSKQQWRRVTFTSSQSHLAWWRQNRFQVNSQQSKSSNNAENFQPYKKCHLLQQVEVTSWSGSLNSIPEDDHRRCVNTKASIFSHHVLFEDLQPSLSDLLSSQENHIMPLSEAHTPTSAVTCSLSLAALSLSLSLSGDSFTILCSRSNPDLWGSLTGPLLIVQLKRQPAEGEMTALGSHVFHSLLPPRAADIPSPRMLLRCYSLQPALPLVRRGLFTSGSLLSL